MRPAVASLLLVVGLVAAGLVLTTPLPLGSALIEPTGGADRPELPRRVEELERRVTALERQTGEPGDSHSGTGSEGASPSPLDPVLDPQTDPGSGFPTVTSAGLPAGWEPVLTVEGGYTVKTDGATLEDMRIVGDLVIAAENVVVRRVEVIGGSIDNWYGSVCHNGLVIEDSVVRRGTSATTDKDSPSIGTGGYVADNVLIDGPAEGFRVGGKTGGCGPVTISDTYVRVVAPDQCADWHGDAIQGFGGSELTVRNSVLVLDERPGCSGTAPFFYPQGNTSVDVDGLVVQGGGYPFRLGTPGSVRNLNIVNGWGYGPVDVRCALLTDFVAQVVALDSAGQPVEVRRLSCHG